MDKKKKYICRCGSRVEKLTTFIHAKGRVTMCDKCIEESGIANNKEYDQKDYSSEIEEKRPIINNQFKIA